MKPDNFQAAYTRIREATNTKTQTEVAHILGIKQSSISDAKGKQTIPDGWLVKLYLDYRLEPDYILYGLEPKVRQEGLPSAEYITRVAESRGGYGPGPKQLVVLGMAGVDKDTMAWLGDPLEAIAVPDKFLTPGVICVKMEDAVMEPTIRKGAYVGIDTTGAVPRSGEIYAVDVPGEGLVVKRLHRDIADGRLTLVADNPLHREQHLPQDNPAVRVIGRVSFIIQAL